ncbi:MAG: ABC transporter permease [Bacteroidales bacterium]|jgi:peptide/nickel transport system permease protein|nr:ABC transporter permease [Bacteroidales bacterium]
MFLRKKKTKEYGKLSSDTWKRFRKNPLSIISFIIIVFFILISVLGYLITPDKTPFANEQHLEIAVKKPGFKIEMLHIYDQNNVKTNFVQTMVFGKKANYKAIPVYKHWQEKGVLYVETYTGDNPNDGEIISIPHSNYKIITKRYILGTDRYGRDMLSQLMIGTRVSLSVGLIAVVIAVLIGVTLGSIAGYFGGWADKIIMWLINVVWSLPTILLVIAITFALGKGFWQVFVAVGLTMWVDLARMVRGQVMSLKEKEFVEAGRAMGFTNFRIIFYHILPNVVGAISVITASNFATAILQEAGLSFLGIGVQPPMPSWGTMIKENYGYIILDAAYMAIIPGLAIMLLVFAFMMLGSGLRQAMNVREK